MKISLHLDQWIERYDGFEMGFIAWLFGSKPCFRTDGFESIMARVFVVTWSANFESIRSSLRVDRLDSIYLGEFEPMEDTSSWLVDPVGSNEATQDGFEHGITDGFEHDFMDGFEHDFMDGFKRGSIFGFEQCPMMDSNKDSCLELNKALWWVRSMASMMDTSCVTSPWIRGPSIRTRWIRR